MPLGNASSRKGETYRFVSHAGSTDWIRSNGCRGEIVSSWVQIRKVK